MKKVKDSPQLRQVFSRMLFFRLFTPIMVVSLISIAAVSYLGKQNLENHQNQVAQSIANLVDNHLDQGTRILDAVARVAETSGVEDLSVFIKSTREAYGHFETIYSLDKDNKITLITPFDARYTGLDMSNLPDLKVNAEKERLFISPPFISLRTGVPTVYLIRYLFQGGCVIGELNLGVLQDEITNIAGKSSKDFIFIMDQTGKLIVNPSLDLVKQQTNMSNLEIFHSVLSGKSNAIYSYDGEQVIGSAVRLERTGWIIVNQTLLSVFSSYYAWIFVLVLLVSLIIWITMMWNLRKEFHIHVITPLEQLTHRTNALTIGDFNKVNSLHPIPTAFVEINKLLVDFQFMSNNLQSREAALLESESRYRGLVDRLPIGLFRAKLTGEILDVNPVFFSILKYPLSDQLLEGNIIDFLCQSSINKKAQQFMIENICDLSNFETQVKRSDGKNIWIQIDSHIVYNYEGKDQFFEGTIQDITERRQTESKIKDQQELLFKVEKEKREALEKALIMKDEFISLISHELKTPLNVIYSAIQLIEGVYFNGIPERVQGLIGNIKQNTFRQLRLANNLLDYTKINSGQFKLDIKNIDIVFSTKVITKSVEVYAAQKNIKMSFKSNVQSKIISIDEEKFERIILNVLSNAIKFTDDGGEIGVAINENIKSNSLQIKVVDTGIGIPKDKQELIFERFGQVDSNLSRRAEGTGIGLSLVKLLVDILEGTIGVESEIGVGSTFIITLPIKGEIVENEADDRLDIDSRLVNEIKVQFSDIYF